MRDIFESVNEVLLDMEELFDKNEYKFIKETIESKAIPTPKLLVRDHKPRDKEGKFPTRIVVSATNFTAAFSKIGYTGITFFSIRKTLITQNA